MKTTLIAVFLLTFTAIVATHAEVYERQTTGNERNAGYGSLFENASGNESNRDLGSGTLFRNPGDEPLEGRPDNGGGIGQEMPIGKGGHILAVCCLIYGIFRFSSKKGRDKLDSQ